MEKQVPLTVQKLYEHYFWQKLSKFKIRKANS